MSNLTVKIKPGNIKSVSNPVYCRIGNKLKKVKGDILKKGTTGKYYGLNLNLIFSGKLNQ